MHYDVLRGNEKLQVISDVSGVLSARHKGAPSKVVPGCHWNELSSPAASSQLPSNPPMRFATLFQVLGILTLPIIIWLVVDLPL